MRKNMFITVSMAIAFLFVASPAFAINIYLNGVDIGGVRGQTFKNVESVFIDSNGDVHMSAPGYKVEVVDDDKVGSHTPAAVKHSEAGANPALRSRYFMATRPSQGGQAQYDYVIRINGVERKVVKAGSPVIIIEISAWFKKGTNVVELIGKKNLAGGRKSTSTSVKSEILIGAGHEEGTIVKMDLVHGSLKGNASQITDIKKSFTINAI